jgi:WD40 repeat protein
VTASTNLLVRVWDLASTKSVSQPLAHADAVKSAVYSLDGSRVATASVDGTARVWDADTAERITGPLKHGGAVRCYAMAGGSRNHNTLAFNLGSLVGAGLLPSCQGYSSNMKIHVRRGKEDIFYYPDLSVSCREEGGNDYYNDHPVLIIEVLGDWQKEAYQK